MDASSLFQLIDDRRSQFSFATISSNFTERRALYSIITSLALALITLSCLSFLNVLSIPNVSNQIVGPLFVGLSLICLGTIIMLCKKNKVEHDDFDVDIEEIPRDVADEEGYRKKNFLNDISYDQILSRLTEVPANSYFLCELSRGYVEDKYMTYECMICKDSAGRIHTYESSWQEYDRIIKDKKYSQLLWKTQGSFFDNKQFFFKSIETEN